MVTSTCPDRNDLRSFHLGMLDERRELEVLDHLNVCQACEDTVANLEGTVDSLVAAVRGSVNSEIAASSSGNEEDRPALQQALVVIEGFIDQPVSPDAKQEKDASPVSERIRDYELLGTLGEGGMGTVYRARHTRLDRQVALKLLPARRLRDNAAVARFEREMKAIGRLDHPTIVRATDAGDVDGTHFLAMDYVEGIDLSKLVRLVGPLDVASACEIVRQAALGLDYAHRQDLIHRDVKPSNLMLTLRGEVRILDLGLALFGAASEALDELTTVGQLMGTLDYMAPEQGDNSHDVDARADVYSLGATLFKLLTASAPYDSPDRRTPLAKMKALATIDAPSVAERRSELPADLVAVVDRALLRSVDERFASAKELADSIQPFCEGHVLKDLAECGRDLALREDENVPQPPTLPPFVSRPDISVSKETPDAQIRATGNEPGHGRKLARWILIPMFLLSGIVTWVQTDNGTLLIEADESVSIEIRRTGKPAQRETLNVGQNSLTISSGDYEIVLPREYDSLKVENGKFELSRGGTWIARVTKQAAQPAPATAFRQLADLPQPNPYRPQPDSNAPSPASSDPFAPTVSGAVLPAWQAGPVEAESPPRNHVLTGIDIPFELETTVWEIDQKAIREGVTGPPLLSPRSAMELLDPIVLGDFKYPHEEFRDQSLPPFVLYRTRENVAQVLTAPPLIKCVRKVRTTPTKSEHDPEPKAGHGAYTDADAGFMTSDGSRYNRRLAPSLNAAGQMTLTLEFERALRIGEPGAEARTHRKTFAVDPLREDETLVVLEVDPEADKVWLWEIKPGQNGRNLLAKSVSATLPTVALKAADVPFGLRTTVWRINQKVLRSGAIQPVTIQPLSAAGLLNRLVSYKFSGPQHPYPALEMALTRTDVGEFLTQPGLDRCCQQVNIWDSRHDFTRQVGPLSGPLNKFEGLASAADKRKIDLTLTPELKESGEIALNLLVKREPGDDAGVFAGDVPVGAPATQSFRIETLALHETLIVTELDPLADEFLLFEIQPVRDAAFKSPFAEVRPVATTPYVASHSVPTVDPSGLSAPRLIPPGMRVVTVATGSSGSNHDLIKPGDRVDLLGTFPLETGNSAQLQVQQIAESLEVFTTDANAPEELRNRNVALLVTPDQARIIKLAEHVGRLHIALRHNGDNPTTKPATAPGHLRALEKLLMGLSIPANDRQSEPVYSGKTFEDWKRVVDTERNPADLVEAVQALTILGKDRRDSEAATAVLNCLAPFSPDSRLRKTPEGKLIDTIQDRFWQLDRAALTAVLVETIQLGNSNQRRFILVLNESRLKKMVEPDGPLLTSHMVNVLVEATGDADPDTRRAATVFLTPLLLGNTVSLPDAELGRVTSRLKELLGDEKANLAAAVCLSQLAPETEGLPKILLSGIEEFLANETDRTLQLTDSYWALRKLIVQDQSVQEKLTPQLLELLKKQRTKPSAHVFSIDYCNFDHECLIAEVLVAGKRRSDTESKQIQVALLEVFSTATRLARPASAREEFGAGAFQKLELTENSPKTDTTAYTPVLTDDYRLPLPPEFRRQRAPDGRQADAAVTAAAAAWALEQLKVNGTEQSDQD
tara:strand:+ start:108104 stop:112846 length:4743 start_codon:yes stop_codon:yes gene_type:complete